MLIPLKPLSQNIICKKYLISLILKPENGILRQGQILIEHLTLLCCMTIPATYCDLYEAKSFYPKSANYHKHHGGAVDGAKVGGN